MASKRKQKDQPELPLPPSVPDRPLPTPEEIEEYVRDLPW